jgi:Uma2 family endonuclease
MLVSSTEIQNNFGKYLALAVKEDIIITKNGNKTAVLKAYTNKSDFNIIVKENVPKYSFDTKRVSYEEFLKITQESDERYEYIDGEIYLLASPKTTHQRTLTELFGLFYNFFKGKKCIPMIAPYNIKLRRHEKDINVVQPDLMVICDLEENIGEDDYYNGVPVLVLEVISDSSRGKDCIKKLDLYMSCGVNEYWLVDPYNHQIHIYHFKNKDVEMNRTFNENEIITSFYFKELKFDVKNIFV